ncbi:MAG: hypothetical protein L0H70_04135 [Xanthomonadales bacterium]|nr:hypothetical protein [Xanthomonadales bacterium]
MNAVVNEKRLCECIGTCFALRAGMAALFKAHPTPAALRQSLRQVQSNSESEIAALGPDVLAAFDQVTVELLGWLKS